MDFNNQNYDPYRGVNDNEEEMKKTEVSTWDGTI